MKKLLKNLVYIEDSSRAAKNFNSSVTFLLFSTLVGLNFTKCKFFLRVNIYLPSNFVLEFIRKKLSKLFEVEKQKNYFLRKLNLNKYALFGVHILSF